MRKPSALLSVLILALFASPSASAGRGSDAEETVRALNQQFSALVAKGDAGALTGLYAEGAQVFPPNEGMLIGRPDIRHFWQTFIEMGMKGLTLEIAGAEQHGEVIIETGKYVVLGPQGQEMDHGKYLVVWKRSGKNWRIYRDIWNSSVPAPPPSKPAGHDAVQ